MEYRKEIDGLRALAVLPVIFFHAGFDIFSGGFVGVDIFFVISGYLITTIIINEMSSNNFSLINFYERRARRILPALFFVMLLSIPFAWFWLTPSDLEGFGKSLIAVSTFSSNILFWRESGYFGAVSELKPLLHTWSLAVEEQYYIIFPLFLMLLWKAKLKLILLSLFFIFLLSLTLAHWSSFNYPIASFYLLPTRGWELLIGVFIAFYLKDNKFFKSSKLNESLSLFGFGLIVYSIFYFNESTPFPSLYALIPTLGTGILILTAVPNTLMNRFLGLSPIVGVGLISYSAYLWHQPILAFARHRFFDETPKLMTLLLILGSFILAYVSWRWVEKPFRNKKITTRKTIFIFSFAGIIFFSLVGGIFINLNGAPERVNFSTELQKSFERPSVENCFDFSFDEINLDNFQEREWGCFLGEKKESIDYIFFGDSHSLSLKDRISSIAKERRINVFYAGLSSCLPFQGIYMELRGNCNLLNKMILTIAKRDNVKGLVLSAKWALYLSGDYSGSEGILISENRDGPFLNENRSSAFTNTFHKTIKEFNNLKIPLHIISQPPLQYRTAESSYFKVAKNFGNIKDFSVKKKDFERLESFSHKLFAHNSDKITYHHILELFCNDNYCEFGNEKYSYYYDDDHLSILGSHKLNLLLEQIFENNS